MNSSAKGWIRKISNKFFWGQHPEAALRYLPVVAEIKKRKLLGATILEIGSGSLGIVPYFKRNIDGLDINFEGPQTKYLRKIKGSADKIPFKRNSFDVSVSVDVLEHLPKEKRDQAIYEQLRVARKLCVIVVPCGKDAQHQDETLKKRWNLLFKNKNQFLDEHVKHGLPEKSDILIMIKKSLRKLNKKAEVSARSNLNLSIRYFLMKSWITRNKFLYYSYLKGYLIFIPVLKLCNFGKTYRHVFVIEFAS